MKAVKWKKLLVGECNYVIDYGYALETVQNIEVKDNKDIFYCF